MVQAAQDSSIVRTARRATPERWQRALARGLAEGVTVRQVNDSGAWVATSGTDATMACLLEVTGNVAHGCSCPAGEHDDPVCKHRAAYFILIGALDPTPEPDPPAPAAPVVCFSCRGHAVGCPVCADAGLAPIAAQAAALVASADALAA
jgi:hypothetical protein